MRRGRLDARVRSHLVLTLGFSQHNAERAIEMFRAGELTDTEKVVINSIMLNPDYDRPSRSLPVMRVADHLNYRITQAGGMARTPSRCS